MAQEENEDLSREAAARLKESKKVLNSNITFSQYLSEIKMEKKTKVTQQLHEGGIWI